MHSPVLNSRRVTYHADGKAVMRQVDFRVVFLLGVLFFLPYPARCAIIHVPADKPTIQEGVDASLDGDEILVADGIYTGSGNKDIDLFGKSLRIASENGPERCIIDIESNGRAFDLFDPENRDAVIEGFTIRNGFHWDGGGIRVLAGSAQIADCRIENCVATREGGGVYLAASASMHDCDIISNSAFEKGGGIFCSQSSRIIRCRISSNTALNGGGVATDARTCSISETTITGNSASSGGGVYCDADQLVLNRCIIRGNAVDFNGGGLFCDGYSATSLENTIVDLNTAGRDGGGLYGDDQAAAIHMVNCLMDSNEAQHHGGGLACLESVNPVLVNSIVRSNAPDQFQAQKHTVRFCNVQGGCSGIGNIDADPGFIDAATCDYRLQTTSICMDTGTDETAPTEDIDGYPRPSGGAFDIGPHEAEGRPSAIRVHLKIPTHVVHADDLFNVSLEIWNPSVPADDSKLFVVLDLHGQYYCAPAFISFDYYEVAIPTGLSTFSIVPSFRWPDLGDSEFGIVWYSALLNPELTRLETPLSVFEFAWDCR